MKATPPLLVLLTSILILGWRMLIPDALRYQENMLQESTKVVTALFAIALFLERSTAVINGLLFSENLRAIEATLAQGNLAQDKIATTSAEARLTELDAQRERVRLMVSFVFAVFVAAAGTRTLAGLLVVTDHSPHLKFFNAVDVVLTAGLLAGGSNALGILADTLKSQVKLTLHRLRAAT